MNTNMNTAATLQSIYQTLTHRPIRDLAWALLHPPLFTRLPFDENDELLSNDCLTPLWLDDDLVPWLTHLDQHPQLFFEHLREQRATRLGIYFEQLLSFYFSHYPRFELIAKNLQANNAQRTIGEYDFIVKDTSLDQYLHIEVAIKFYVGLDVLDVEIPNNTPTHNWHYWVGPNKHDSLAIKMNHLCDRQLRLSATLPGKEALRSVGIEKEPMTPKLLLTGCLYQPSSLEKGPLEKHTPGPDQTQTQKTSLRPHSSLPDYSHHSEEISSFWLSQSNLLGYLNSQSEEYGYVILPRQQWMSPLVLADIHTFELVEMNSSTVEQAVNSAFTHSDTPLYLAKTHLNHNQSSPTIEICRFFVLPNSAPNPAPRPDLAL